MMKRKEYNKEKMNDAYNWPMYFRELGIYIRKNEEYERSLQFFDKSLDKDPNNLRSLQNRAVARAKSKRITGALEDIAKILTLFPEDIYSKAEKALITYLSCEFEDSLILNYRNVEYRKKPDNFVMGVMHCEDAIMNCIAERGGKPLRDHFKVIRQIAWRNVLEKRKPYKPLPRNKPKKKRSHRLILPTSLTNEELDNRRKKKELKKLIVKEERMARSSGVGSRHSKESLKVLSSSLAQLEDASSIKETLEEEDSSQEKIKIPPAPSFPYRPLQRHTTNIENYLAVRYLDQLFYDKLLLKNLPSLAGASTANKKGSEKIEQLATQSFKNLYRTQEILRARRPFYFIKYQEMRSCGKLQEREQATLLLLKEMAKTQGLTLITKIREAFRDRKYRKLLQAVEKLVVFCESTPKTVFPLRDEYLTEMEDIICEGFYQMKKFSPEMTDKQKNDRVKLMLGLPLKKFPSKDSIAKDMKEMVVDWKKMRRIYEARLFRARSPGELAWLYHELSRFSVELNHHEMARIYARKCMKEANIGKKIKWILNAMLIITKIDVFQKNKNDAKNQVKYARKIATRLKDNDMLEVLNLCVEKIEQSAVDEATGLKLLHNREQHIIRLLTTQEMKNEAAFMFRRIQTLPPSKRMSVLPGFSFVDDRAIRNDPNYALHLKSLQKSKRKSTGEIPEKRGIGFLDLLL